jgi:hypothetical protein
LEEALSFFECLHSATVIFNWMSAEQWESLPSPAEVQVSNAKCRIVGALPLSAMVADNVKGKPMLGPFNLK